MDNRNAWLKHSSNGGEIYLRVWTEASKIIFEGTLHCGQLKKNEMTEALSSTLTVRVITKKAEERGGRGGGTSKYEIYVMCLPLMLYRCSFELLYRF